MTYQLRLKTLLILPLCGFVSLIAKAQDVERDEFFKREISIPLTLPTTSDYLLEMAKSADVNVFADATDFLKDAPPMQGEWSGPPSSAKGGKWSGVLGNLLMLFDHEHWLTWRNLGDGKFLVWADQGETRSIGFEVVQGRGLRFQEAGDEVAAIASLKEYLQQQHGWDGTSNDFNLEIPLTQLPVGLRSTLLAARQRDILQQSRYAQQLAVFHDEFWDNARLKVISVPGSPLWDKGPGNGPQRMFFLHLEGEIPQAGGGTLTTTIFLKSRDQAAGKVP